MTNYYKKLNILEYYQEKVRIMECYKETEFNGFEALTELKLLNEMAIEMGLPVSETVTVDALSVLRECGTFDSYNAFYNEEGESLQ